MNIDRHKVFISYYHNDDQEFKNLLVNKVYYDYSKNECVSIFDDYSVGNGDIDDTNLTDEQIRRKIRDEYMREATVLILLCGENTKNRKHIDWEIHTAMYNSEKNRQMGIIVINLPSISRKQCVRVSTEDEKELVSPNSILTNIKSYADAEQRYPYMPKRILDNIAQGKEITVVNWSRIDSSNEILMQLIDNAFKRKDNIKYDHSMPLQGRNTVCARK